MAIEGSDADLDEPAGQAALHDPCEGGSVGVRIAFEVMVKIRMGIEVEDVDRAMNRGDGFDRRKADGMISAEHQRHCALRGGGADGIADQREVPLGL